MVKGQLFQYYLNQACRGAHSGIGPIYSVPLFLQRGHGVGSVLSGLSPLVQPVLWSGVRAVGRETLRTGGKILSDLADNTAGDVRPRHIVAKHVSHSAQNLIQNLLGRGRKRVATLHSRGYAKKRRRRRRLPRLRNRHLFIGLIISYPTMAADVVSASTEFDIFATRPVQSSTTETTETAYKPIASLVQSDLEFPIPANHDTYIDLNIQL